MSIGQIKGPVPAGGDGEGEAGFAAFVQSPTVLLLDIFKQKCQFFQGFGCNCRQKFTFFLAGIFLKIPGGFPE
jgi:hypothetical protein